MHTRYYIDNLYTPDELLALVLLDGGKSYGKQSVGFYRDREEFFKDVVYFNGRGNLYINLQRLHPDLFGRAADRVKPYSATRFTNDEVIWRPRLCVDIDPVRLSGINSTDTELESAIELGSKVYDYLIVECDVNVVAVHSGNGVQLVFPIDEPTDSPLVSQFLKHLDNKFSTSHAKIDTSLSDAARIVRLPGTLNCKGDDIPERPRRLSHILEMRSAAQPC
ncbi:hypothetical protein [Lacipirellula sp.]|uniref:hypothetical protein n=1 Tax=Lacipirellula sp. TaxID=2691419 RepID=UPI003D1193F6